MKLKKLLSNISDVDNLYTEDLNIECKMKTPRPNASIIYVVTAIGN